MCDWVQLNFGSILFDKIRWAKRKELSIKETLKEANHLIKDPITVSFSLPFSLSLSFFFFFFFFTQSSGLFLCYLSAK